MAVSSPQKKPQLVLIQLLLLWPSLSACVAPQMVSGPERLSIISSILIPLSSLLQPGKDSVWLPLLVALRLVFVPLFMLCNVQPRSRMPVWFEHDAWYIVFMILFSFSNGYLASLCMCFGPK